jgi:hypothetical protein
MARQGPSAWHQEVLMNRAFFASWLLLAVAGCQLPPERAAPPLLPENAPPQTYTDLIRRARRQADAADEVFFMNKWSELEEAAKGLEQTARFLNEATDVPAKHKDTLKVEAEDLGKDAVKLREAAKAQQVEEAKETLRRIILKVRDWQSGK